jgi:molybdopterin-guanine dinucleotide biosynthesis protein A
MCLCHHVSVTIPGVSAAILAGGRARRFGGRDKCRLVVEGRTIIVRQIEVLQRIAQDVIVIANDASRFADLELDVRPDVIPESGALGGIYTALATARHARVIVVACDQPFLDDQLLARLAVLAEGHDGAWVRSSRGVEPLLACYQTASAPRVKRAIETGQLKATDLGDVLAMAEIDEQELASYGPVDRLLANVNSPEDFARVQ